MEAKKEKVFTVQSENMEYAIRLLERDRYLVNKCLSDWDIKNYPEARKRRLKVLKQLELAINKLKENE